VGETSAATAREVEQTRKQMEDKVAKLSERAPEEARKLVKRVVFGVLTAVAVLMARKLVDKLWERATGELPPTKVATEDEE
jgi:ribosomal protein L31E